MFLLSRLNNVFGKYWVLGVSWDCVCRRVRGPAEIKFSAQW